MIVKKEKRNSRKRPTFVLLVAISIDGKITNGTKEGNGWTSKEDKRIFHQELDRCDVAVMGRKTFEAIERPLTPRNRIVFSMQKTFSRSSECEHVIPGDVRSLNRLIQKNAWGRIAIVGGTQVYDWFLEHDLIDEMYITIEPVIFGSGRPFTDTYHSLQKRFTLVSSKKLNKDDTLLLHYTITHS
ncbi:MAG: hypothetical protein COV91_02120 [Candidatus Taylorbacteria bacterium CG11_big_fil_rev_8_21_14_0_20_46_11]|uniref:Bacterial bifunctional deaminase-reductase C-terminal domain-containing protein n=1 Tax=Candidatus Taylorbacteria bacterium CG11_big_fil_rev_8_21_14_0_20_46_11 TaxID=1975025 RepID=A0A2H0KC97_9BACT|nr:MAG: hypothetical protein COV91_02120 [Candidatus Taylorbacteria bacterium CG11_big_fil_rev_8_21_14_0_20_46_11]